MYQIVFLVLAMVLVCSMMQLVKNHCGARNFDCGGEEKMENFCDVILVTFIGCVIMMWWHHWNDIKTDFLKFNFVIINLKNNHLAKSHNFRSPTSNIKMARDREFSRAWWFLKIWYKKCILDISQLKFS